MIVKCTNCTPLFIASQAIRQCWDSRDKSDTKSIEDFTNDLVCRDGIAKGYAEARYKVDDIIGNKDKDLIYRIGNQNKHKSVLEHLYYNFDIYEISRAVLQELARHRIASLSVKSTRYTLKELIKELPFVKSLTYSDKRDGYSGILRRDATKRASKYIVLTGNDRVDFNNIVKLDMLRTSIQSGIGNDIAKYELPECYKVNLTWSVNARALQNFLELRTSPHALKEIRELANNIYDALPEEHKYLFTDSLYDENVVSVTMTKQQYLEWKKQQ